MPSEHPTTYIEELPAQQAARLLPQSHFDYFYGSAGDERTYRDNLDAFRCVHFIPRMFISVSTVGTTATIKPLGTIPQPFMIAPMAMQKLAHADGEIAVARAAKRAGLPMILSTFSTTSLEDVAKVGGMYMLQLYLYKDRDVSLELIQRAKRAGFKGVVLTVDAPHFGRRERDRSNKFALPSHLTLANFAHGMQSSTSGSGLNSLSSAIDQDVTPNTIRWLTGASPLPVWVKGVLHPADADKAIAAGAQGIVVSNHGARQLEGTIPTLEALPAIAAAVKRRVPVLLDSGVRTGEDVVRAIALGADAVLLGRPLIWGLAANGEDGVHEVLTNVSNGVQLCMALLGARKVQEISKDMVVFRREAKL